RVPEVHEILVRQPFPQRFQHREAAYARVENGDRKVGTFDGWGRQRKGLQRGVRVGTGPKISQMVRATVARVWRSRWSSPCTAEASIHRTWPMRWLPVGSCGRAG